MSTPLDTESCKTFFSLDDCLDIPGYVDVLGHKCSAWMGFDCKGSHHGYTNKDLADVLHNCCASCHTKSAGGISIFPGQREF